MNSPTTAVILIGSAKPAGESTSEALATYLAQRLQDHGVVTTIHHAARVLRTEMRIQEFLHAVDRADLFILAFPLYVDSLPYLAIEALERIAAHRLAQPARAPASFLAIANCGFPEAHHNATALAICEQFAEDAGFRWSGGLALGAGGVIDGKSLAQTGKIAHAVVEALDLAAPALAQGEPIPAEAPARMAQPMIPGRIYTLIGGLSWRKLAWNHGVYRRLRDRPFQERPRRVTSPSRAPVSANHSAQGQL